MKTTTDRPPLPLASPARFATIKKLAAAAYGVTIAQVDSRGRTARVALARQHAMALARELLEQIDESAVPVRRARVAHEKIAAAFNRDDHGTSIHAKRVVENLREVDADFRIRDSILREAVLERFDAEGRAAA